MIKSGTSNLPFTILISLYPMGQPARLEEYFRRKKKSGPKWPWYNTAVVHIESVLPSLPFLLFSLITLHSPSQNSPSSLLDSQGWNFLSLLSLLSLSLPLTFPSIPSMTCSGFLRPFWKPKFLLLLLLLLLLPSPP